MINSNGKFQFSLATWIGWGFCGLTAVATIWAIGDALPDLGQVSPIRLLAEVLFRLFPLVFAALAALIITRQPANRIGWLMVLPVFGGILDQISTSYLQAVTVPTFSPFLFLVLWIESISWALFLFPILLILLLFPTGRPPSPRWNWVNVYVFVLVGCLLFLVTTMQDIGPNEGGWTVRNPIGFIPNAWLNSMIWVVALIVLTLVCVAAPLVRYRRGSSVERAQIKWVVYASAIFGVAYAAFLPFLNETNLVADFLFLLFALAMPTLPLAIGIAILHYRLWDIDFVINRSLVYAALTALLVALFGGSLLLINGLFQNFAGGPLVAFTLPAVVFGAVFQPTRRRLQRFVDRRFYHIYIDYQKTPLPTPPSGGMTQVLRQTHFGEYKNLELIGRGGMAEVYKSTHPTLNIPVAIKVLPASLAAEADFRQRFTREAQVVTKLEHSNIVRVFDYGQQNDMQYMVMEYVGNQDLAAFLQANGKLSLASALPLIQQIADALDYAHTHGLVHRDIKPSNILLDTTTDMRVVLTDFGIAKMLDAHTAMTGTGSVLGTFHYIAPEQIETSPKVDGRADVYAFGVMVYQMLTGELPFKHSNPGALLIAHMTQPPPDPRQVAPDLSDDVADAIQHAMAKDPTERFAMAGEFVAELN